MSNITVHNVRLIKEDSSSAVQQFTAEKLHLRYSFLRAAFGPALNALRAVEAHGIHADINLDRVAPTPQPKNQAQSQADNPANSLSPAEIAERTGNWLPSTNGPKLIFDANIRIQIQGRHIVADQLHSSGTLKDLTIACERIAIDEHELGSSKCSISIPSRHAIEVNASFPLVERCQASAIHTVQGWQLIIDANLAGGRVRLEHERNHSLVTGYALNVAELPPYVIDLLDGENIPFPEQGIIDAQIEYTPEFQRYHSQLNNMVLAGQPLDLLRSQFTVDSKNTWHIDQLYLRQNNSQLTLKDVIIDPQEGVQSLAVAHIKDLSPFTLPWLHDIVPSRWHNLTLNGNLELVDELLQSSLNAQFENLILNLNGQVAPSILSSRAKEAALNLALDAAITPTTDFPDLIISDDWKIQHADVSAHLSGSLQNPSLAGNSNIQGFHQENPLELNDVAWELSPEKVLLASFNAQTPWGRWQLNESTTLTNPFNNWILSPTTITGDLGTLRLSAQGNHETLQQASVSFDSDLSSWPGILLDTNANISGRGTITGEFLPSGGTIRGLLRSVDFDGEDELLEPLDCDLTIDIDPSGYRLTALAQGKGGLELSAHAHTNNAWEIPKGSDTLTADLQFNNIDLSFISSLDNDITRTSGTLDGSILASGTISDPKFDGSVHLQNGSIGSLIGLPAISDITAHLDLVEQRLQLKEVNGKFGGQIAHFTGSMPLTTNAGDWDIHGQGSNLLVYSDPDLRIRADCDAQLIGPLQQPLLRGRVGITRLMLDLYINWLQSGGTSIDNQFQLFSLRAKPFNRVKLDVAVKDGPLFSDQRSDLIVSGNTFRGRVFVNGHVRGTLEIPEPSGTVSSPSGRVRLPFTNYRVQRAELIFPPEEPFNPRVNAVARSRIQSHDLEITLSGLLMDPRVEISSSPPISSEQALLLATTGLMTSELGNSSLALATVLPYLGRELQQAMFGRPDTGGGESFFDRFELTTDEDRSEDGLSTVRGNFAYVAAGIFTASVISTSNIMPDSLLAGASIAIIKMTGHPMWK